MNNKQLQSYLAEFLVIVLGILLAFQVEEWRDELGQEREVAAAVQHVYRSLLAGDIIDAASAAFERGLTIVDVVPDVRMLTCGSGFNSVVKSLKT